MAETRRLDEEQEDLTRVFLVREVVNIWILEKWYNKINFLFQGTVYCWESNVYRKKQQKKKQKQMNRPGRATTTEKKKKKKVMYKGKGGVFFFGVLWMKLFFSFLFSFCLYCMLLLLYLFFFFSCGWQCELLT